MPELRDRFEYAPEEIPTVELEQYAKGGYGGGEFALSDQLVVLVIDATNEFVEPEYPNGAETGPECGRAIASLLDVTRDREIPTVYTRYPGYRNPAEVGSWAATLDEEFELLEPEAYEVHDEVKPQEADVVLDKPKPSAFFATQMESVLNFHGAETLLITGLTTSGCIRATVVDAFSRNYDVVVPIECVGDRSQTSHRVNLFDMSMKYASVRPLSEVLSRL